MVDNYLISKSLAFADGLSGDAKIIAMILAEHYGKSITCVSEDMLLYFLVGSENIESHPHIRTYRKRMKKAFYELMEKRVVIALDYLDKKKGVVLDTTNLNMTSEQYAMCDPQSIRKIFMVDKRESESLLRYYLYISFNRYNENKEFNNIVGTKSLTSIAANLNLSYYSTKKYKARLMEMKILYFASKDSYILKDGLIKSTSTVYSFWRDKDKCVRYINSKQQVNTEANAENARILSKKYYYLSTQGKEYPEDEMEAIYRYVRNRNKKIFAYMFCELNGKDDYYKDKKPWSEEYFKDYPFYEKDEEIDFLFGEPGCDLTNSVNPYEDLEGSCVCGKSVISVTNTDYLN